MQPPAGLDVRRRDRSTTVPMSVAEHAEAVAGRRRRPAAARERRWPWWLGIVALLVGAAALRVWGVGQGLPYAYNADENAHFVPGAIGLFGHGYNPHYFVNPPAYTYVLHAVFGVWFGGRDGRVADVRDRPDAGLDRRAADRGLLQHRRRRAALPRRGAALRPRGRAAVGRGARRRVPAGLLLAPGAQRRRRRSRRSRCRCGAPPGSCRRGRAIDYVLAGVGLGLACATKYTGGIVLLPLLAAGIIRVVAGPRRAGARRRAARALPARLALAGLRRRQPVRDPGLRGVPRRSDPPGRRLQRGAGQARPDPGVRRTSTTCGR